MHNALLKYDMSVKVVEKNTSLVKKRVLFNGHFFEFQNNEFFAFLFLFRGEFIADSVLMHHTPWYI